MPLRLLRHSRLLVVVFGLLSLSSVLSGCLPVVAVAVGAGAFSAIDRRTMGAQIEDQSLQSRGNQRLKEVLPGDEEAYATIYAYNRRVLIVGRSPDEKTKEQAEKLVGSLGNVRLIHNELRVGGPVISAARDTGLTARVRTELLKVKDLDINAVKIVSEDSVVYLLGLVTQKESELASEAASKASGVKRVVTLLDVISQQELDDLIGRPNEPPSSQRK